jgi:hypothetical protein
MSDGSTPLGDLGVAVEGAAEALAAEFAAGTTFDGLPTGGAGSDGSLFPNPLALSGSTSLVLGSTNLALGASGSYQVFALTGGFQDPDKIVSPQTGFAWLKYELDAKVSASGSGGTSSVTVGLDVGATARLLDYRRHPATDKVAEDVLAEIAKPRLPYRIGDLREMAAGDSVGLVASGTLAFSAAFTYADLLPGTVSILDQHLGVAGAAAFEISTGAKVEVDFSADDELSLIFSRGTARDFSIDVKKVETTRLGATGTLGVTARFKDPTQLATLVQSYLTARLGTPYQQIQSLLGKLATATDASQLSPAEQQLLQAIVTKLNLGDVQAQFNAVRTKILALPADLQNELVSTLSDQLQFAFTASYTRIETDQTLVSFEASDASLEKLLPSLVVGDLRPVTAALTGPGSSDLLLHNYLSSQQITTQRSFGFSLSIGGWAAMGKTTTTVSESTQKNIAQQAQQVRWSFDGTVVYQSKWGNPVGESYGFELTAAMPDFAPQPTAANLTLGAKLSWIWEDVLSPALETRILDLANIWRILDIADRDKQVAALSRLAGQSVHAELALTLSDPGVRSLVCPQNAWINAMAESLPRLLAPESSPVVDFRQRQKIYPGVAAWTFGQTSGAQLGRVPSYAESVPPLSTLDEIKLRQIDLPTGPNQDNNWAVYSLDALWNPAEAAMRKLYDQVSAALLTLRSFLASEADYHSISKAFSGLQAVAKQEYPARLLGSLVSQVLGGGGIVGLVSGALTVTPTGGGDAIVLAGSSPPVTA